MAVDGVYALLYEAKLQLNRLAAMLCLNNLAGIGTVALVVYLLLCQVLRFQRVRKLERKYRKKTSIRDDEATIGRPDVSLTPQEMQEIMFTSLEYDMPGLMIYALTFAIFKTYGIPTISEILVKTQELSGKENVSRRVADTGILVSVWMHCPYIDARNMKVGDLDKVDSRSALAVARTNWLHNRYPQIKNDDYKYTMYLFLSETTRWAKMYGWRELLPIEEEAYFQYWRLIGARMNIQDVPETLAELRAWGVEYEEGHMVPARSNFDLADHTIAHLLRSVPTVFGLRAFMEQVIHSMLEERVREAMWLPDPPAAPRMVANSILVFFRFVHRHLCLPRLRPSELTPRELPKHQRGKDMPRMHPTEFESEPWYKPEPTGLGWLLQTALVKIGMKDPSHVPGPRFKSDGFRIEELGPKRLENLGHAEVMKIAEEIQGCPVRGPWARKTA